MSRKLKKIVAQNNKELLSQIKDLVSSSISDLKRSSDANSAEQMSEIKRLKRDARETPSTSGVNTFAQDWSNDNNWLCPPVCLTCKVLSHLKVCIVVPLWRTA